MKKITIFLFFFIGVFIYPIVTIYCQAPDISIQKSYDIEYYTRFHDFKQTSDGGYLICGSSSEIGTTLYDDIIIIKTNSDGETVWIKRIGETENSEYANCIQLTSDDGSIIAGHNWGTKTTLVIKLDDEGSIIWNKEYHAESEQQSVANYIQKTNDNNFVITGKVKNAPSGSGEEDVFLFKVNNDGDLIWEKIYGGTNIDIAWKVEQLDDNGFLIFGTTQSFGA